jgi:hypothetical protein
MMDRWIFWPAFASLGSVFFFTLVCGLPGPASLIAEPAISVLICAIASFVFLVVALISAIRMRPRKAVSFLLALVMPILLWWPINWAADCAHLGLTAWFGAGELGSSSKPDRSDFEIFDWSVGFAGGQNTFLIFDRTDEIALPLAQHTQPETSENGLGEECAGKVRHLVGHYYVCRFS